MGLLLKPDLALLTVILVVAAQGGIAVANGSMPRAQSKGTGSLEQAEGAAASSLASSANVGDYTVSDSKGAVCMKMQFSCQINITYTKTNKQTGKVVVNLNPDSGKVVSMCKSPVRTLTIYPFPGQESAWQASLEFTKQSGGYVMTTVGLTWEYDSRFVDSAVQGWSSQSVSLGNFLDQQVPLGSYYTCPTAFQATIGPGTILLDNMKLQPFAEQSSGQFGKVEVCSPGLSQTTVIVIAAASGVGALSITMLVLRVVCKIKKKRYKRFQDESATAQT